MSKAQLRAFLNTEVQVALDRGLQVQVVPAGVVFDGRRQADLELRAVYARRKLLQRARYEALEPRFHEQDHEDFESQPSWEW